MWRQPPLIIADVGSEPAGCWAGVCDAGLASSRDRSGFSALDNGTVTLVTATSIE